MSKPISLKIEDSLYQEMERLIKRFHLPKNAYINKAIAHFNKHHKRRLLAEAFRRESQAVQGESMRVLAEFEALEDNLP